MKGRNIFLLSGPSGAGEDSIVKGLKNIFEIEPVITTTTRAMRSGESQGNPYYFITKDEFLQKIDNNDFFEHVEEDGNNCYGITHTEIQRILNSDKIVTWRIEYKGAITIKKLIPESTAILITAPLEILEQRIRSRDEVTDEFVKERMEYAKGWFENKQAFDFEVVNEQGKLDEAVKKVSNIINNRLKR